MVRKTKTCTVCRDRKSLTEFYKSYMYKDGLLPNCKSCVLEYDRKRCENHPGPLTTGTKVCSFCKNEKDVKEFSKRLRAKDGLRSRCKECDRAAEKEYRQKNPTREYFAKIRFNYGINKSEYLEMLEKQDYKCKICNELTKLVVDHCHTTTKVRGLLCAKCNAGLGMFEDNTENLENAIKYLKENRNE